MLYMKLSVGLCVFYVYVGTEKKPQLTSSIQILYQQNKLAVVFIIEHLIGGGQQLFYNEECNKFRYIFWYFLGHHLKLFQSNLGIIQINMESKVIML